MAGRLKRIVISIPFLGLVVAVCTLPSLPLAPAPGLDPAWGAGLYMASAKGLVFGKDVIFTYGPLGYLSLPTLWFTDLGTEAVAYTVIVQILACTAVLWAASRIFNRLLAVVVTVLACSFLGPPLVAIAVIVSGLAITKRADERIEWLLPFPIALLAAFAFLVKVNTGVEIFAIGVVSLLAYERRAALPRFLVFGSTFLVALVLLWLLAGQPLAALPDYASSSIQIVSGYSEAMGLTKTQSHEGLYVILAILLCGAGITAAWMLNPQLERRRRISFTLLVALIAFLSFKEGFVRQDAGHAALFVSAMVTTWFVLGWRRPLGLLGIASLAAILCAALLLRHEAINPVSRISSTWELAKTMASSERRHALTDFGRAGVLADQAIPQGIISEIGERPVQVGPYETSAVWANGLNWDPLPVYQDYSAYTPELDRKNADALRSPDGPEVILRHPSDYVPDRRLTEIDPPETTREMLCNFAPQISNGAWLLLHRIADRCGAEHRIGHASAAFGDPIAVPAGPPQSLVLVRLHGVQVTGLERIRAMLFRAKNRFIGFVGAQGEAGIRAEFRLVPGTAADGIVLRAPASIDYPEPFALPPDPSSFIISGDGLSGTIDADFYAVPVDTGRSGGSARGRGGADAHRSG